ncbi:hypothetical protein BDU57DRAFT_578540, partial [Ampelomyces quisqualis]
ARDGSTSMQDYNLHTSVLRHRSEYFNTKLKELKPNPRNPVTTFDVESLAAFECFTVWLYQGTLTRPSATQDLSRMIICQIYIFGTRAESPHLQNAALDAFVDKTLHDDAVPHIVFNYLYSNAHNSALWDIALDFLWHCGTKREFSVSEFLEREGATVCGWYHNHPAADKRDGWLFWFDLPV